MKRHWYFITEWYCPLCGRSHEYRERHYGRRPTDPRKRFQHIEYWCGCGV